MVLTVNIFITSFLATSNSFFIYYGIIKNAAVISTIAKIFMVIIVLLGIFFFNERERVVQKIIGFVIALVGVLFLI